MTQQGYITYEIWAEGASLNSTQMKASLLGTIRTPAHISFKQACSSYFVSNPSNYYSPRHNTYWGCKLFDNEADARKSFG